MYLSVDGHTDNSIPNFKATYMLYKGTINKVSKIKNHFLNEEKSYFQLRQNKVIDIYHTGEISKVDLKDAKKVSYIYHDKEDNKHDLGSFNLIEVDELKNGKKLDSVPKGHTKKETISNKREKYTYSDKIVVKGTAKGEKGKIRMYKFLNKKVKLAKIETNPKYIKGDIKIQFKLMTGSTRPYISPNALACVFGVIAEVGYDDITMVGFTSEDNHGFPSTTHVNGLHGDFRYLRTDKSGESLHINTKPKDLDVTRQEKMIDAFNNFGWKKFYSVNFTLNKVQKILKLSTNMPPHHHHLHTRLFTPKYKK